MINKPNNSVIENMYFGNKIKSYQADIAKLFTEHIKSMHFDLLLPNYELKIDCNAKLKLETFLLQSNEFY